MVLGRKRLHELLHDRGKGIVFWPRVQSHPSPKGFESRLAAWRFPGPSSLTTSFAWSDSTFSSSKKSRTIHKRLSEGSAR